METQERIDDEEERPETLRIRDDEELKERSNESTIHTVPELLMDMQKVFTKLSNKSCKMYLVVSCR